MVHPQATHGSCPRSSGVGNNDLGEKFKLACWLSPLKWGWKWYRMADVSPATRLSPLKWGWKQFALVMIDESGGCPRSSGVGNSG